MSTRLWQRSQFDISSFFLLRKPLKYYHMFWLGPRIDWQSHNTFVVTKQVLNVIMFTALKVSSPSSRLTYELCNKYTTGRGLENITDQKWHYRFRKYGLANLTCYKNENVWKQAPIKFGRDILLSIHVLPK